jgi:hypothetical protein
MDNSNRNQKIPFTELLDHVKELTVQEKLVLHDFIWNTSGTAIPEKHQQIVSERIQTGLSKPESLLDWELVSETLKS